MQKKNIILLNPSSGRNRALRNREKLEQLLDQYKVDYELFITKSEENLRRLIRKHSKTARSIVTAGGDSSFTILVNEVMAVGVKPRLGIIPLGSSDDIARELGIYSLEDSILALAEDQTTLADVVKLSAAQKYVYYFSGQANLGIGVFVNRFVAEAQKKGYFNKNQTFSGIKGMYEAFRQKIVPQKFLLKIDGNSYRKDYVSVVFSKIRYWAGGRIFLPDARMNDGKIHILQIGNCRFRKILEIMIKAKNARHIDGEIVCASAAKQIIVESQIPFQIQVDGDILQKNGRELSFNKIKLEVLRKKIRLVVFDKKGKRY